MGRIDLSIDEHIAILTVDDAKTRNALTTSMSDDLVEACEEVDRNPDVGAAIVRGGGGTFCSGADRDVLNDAGANPAGDASFKALGRVYEAFARVGRLGVPTIAAVQGAAVGAGVNLLFATDLRIVAEDARIIAGFMLIGLHPGGGHFLLAARPGNREAAAALGLFGQELSGRRAAEAGLAWEAVPSNDVDSRARELAGGVAKDPELARRAVQSFRSELGPPAVPWPAALELERGSQMWSLRRRVAGSE